MMNSVRNAGGLFVTSVVTLLVPAGCSALATSEPGLTAFQGCWLSSLGRDTLTLFLDANGLPGPVYPTVPRESPIRFEWLLIEGTDSIRLNLGYGGFGGTTVRATLQGDSLVGSSLPFTDEVGGPEPQLESFSARRVTCSPGDWR